MLEQSTWIFVIYLVFCSFSYLGANVFFGAIEDRYAFAVLPFAAITAGIVFLRKSDS